MSDPMDKFRDAVEVMTTNQIYALIEEFTTILNGHVLAADDKRRHLNVLHDEKRRRLVK